MKSNYYNSYLSPSDKSKILVVDDIADNFELIQMILDEYDLEYAQSGYEALNMIENLQPDLLLLDVMMPGIDGFEVARRIRRNQNFSSLPILFITAYDELTQPKEGLDNLGNGLIKKPIDFDELINKVQTLLAKKNMKNQLYLAS